MELFVAEATEQRLRLVRHWRFELILAVVGIALLALFAFLVLQHNSQSTAPLAWWVPWLAFLGFGALCVGLSSVGKSFNIDGNSRVLECRSLWLKLRHRVTAEQIAEVYVSVFNEEGREEVELGISRQSGRKPIRLDRCSTTARDAHMVPVAQRIASLLGIPLIIDGKPVEATEELRQAITHVVETGDAVPVGGPELRINCPRCGARNIPGLAYDYVERFKGIPFTTSWVRCSRCRTALFSKLRAGELEGRSAAELEQVVIYRPRAAMLRKSLAVMALVIGPVPMVGLVVSIPAVIANWRHVKWAKILSLIGLVLSVVTTTLVVILLVKNPPDRQIRTPPLKVPHVSE